MVCQQPVSVPARTGMFLVLTVGEGGEGAVREFLGDVPSLTRTVSFREPSRELFCVVGVGSALWDRTFPGVERPAHLRPFQEIRGAVHHAVATPGDVLIHLRSTRIDMCFELAKLLTQRLGSHARVVDEVHGFAFFDNRDLLGFVDGSENPEGERALAAVTVGEEDAAYAGGSYVIVQKYLHDMGAWDALPVEEQERAIGRFKSNNLEMPADVKPTNSHVALNTVHDDTGTQLQIVRDNLPFGRIGDAEFGTYFIGYAKDPGVIEQMLRNMFIGVPEGNHDRILDFSTPMTGGLFFVPSEEFLADLGS